MDKSLAVRMKENYELRTQSSLPRRTNVIIRLDGKAFHSFTKKIGALKPFDEDLMSRMDMTAKFLCANIQGCQLGYIQSDEISLLLTDFEHVNTDAWFDNNVQKMVSVSASLATGFFNSIPSGMVGHNPFAHTAKYDSLDVNDWLLMADTELAYFDSRAFSIPDKIEVYNYLVWRIRDWERNSLQMLARKYYSHSQLHEKNTTQLHDMLHEAGDNWAKLPDGYKRGRICSKHIGGMWGIYPAPDVSHPDGKKFLQNLIPEYGYGYKNQTEEVVDGIEEKN